MDERRRHRRIFFSVDDQVSGVFVLPESYRQNATAAIMDISREGMGLTFPKDECPQLNQGEQLKLLSIGSSHFLKMAENTRMTVRWVLNHRSLEHIAVGCEFVEATEDFLDRIEALMDEISPV